MSMLKGYRPSSALQAMFSVYHGTFNVCLQNLREGTFFLGGGGRAGEFWYFFPKKVLALPCVLIKKLLTPHL